MQKHRADGLSTFMYKGKTVILTITIKGITKLFERFFNVQVSNVHLKGHICSLKSFVPFFFESA